MAISVELSQLAWPLMKISVANSTNLLEECISFLQFKFICFSVFCWRFFGTVVPFSWKALKNPFARFSFTVTIISLLVRESQG